MLEWPNVIALDENYQVLEPAHRLVFGTGGVAWEFVYGIRSWLYPGVVAALMAVGSILGQTPALILAPVRLFMLAASLVPVVCGYLWGEKLLGRRAAVVTGFVAAVWVDLIYIAPHTLNEVLAADLMTWSLYLGWSVQEGKAAGTVPGRSVFRARLFWTGILLGLVFVLRFQQAPALAFAAACFCGWRRPFDRRRWIALLSGAAIPVLLCDGVLDTLTLGTPFQSVWYNAYLNTIKHVSEEFGVNDFGAYTGQLLLTWRYAALPLLLLLVFGMPLLPLLLRVVLIVIFFHSFIPHKEMRFVFPAFPPMAILIGLGLARLLAWLETGLDRRLRGGAARLAVTGAVLLGFAGMSAAVGMTTVYRQNWQFMSGYVRVMARLAREPGLCAIALDHVPMDFVSPNSFLPPHIRIYGTSPRKFSQQSGAFNGVVTQGETVVSDPAYRRLDCYDSGPMLEEMSHTPVCAWIRAGGCTGEGGPLPESLFRPKALGGAPLKNEDAD